jgi:hypothetical protein
VSSADPPRYQARTHRVASVGTVQISGSRPRKIKAQVRTLEQDVEPELVSEQLSELRDVAESGATSRIPLSMQSNGA